MTSISGSMSPADRIQQMLQSSVTSGTVPAADQSALSSAISDIDTALKPGATSTTNLAPGDMKTKVDDLIDQEVSSGKLTSDQADELKKLYTQAAQSMGHHHGHHVRPTGDDSALSALTATDTSTSTDSATSTASAGTTASNTDSLTSSIQNLMSFLQKLEQATSSTTNYTSSGTSAGSLAQSLLVSLTA